MKNLNLAEASKILTKSEYALYLASTEKQLDKLKEVSLKFKIKRIESVLEKVKTQKLSVKRSAKKAGLKTESAAVTKKKKIQYLSDAHKKFQQQLKTLNKPIKVKSAVKKSSHPKLINEAKAFSHLSKQQVHDQNIKSDAKQSKFLKSGFERKTAHANARNRRFQGKKDTK